ncbi:MAG TPA: hypothetical protein VMU24_12165 [Candidatus Acidoferrales bacterium]|nr:hypothetical protein [Candidatus Acidoferrales bacterium]
MKPVILKRLQFALAALVVVYAFLSCLHTIADFDTGWQLATGRYCLQHHAVPATDVLSYTTQGVGWLYPAFAGSLLYIVFHTMGYAGLSWFCAFAGLLLAMYLLWRSRAHVGVSSVLLFLAVPSLAFRITPRADLFSTVLFAILLLELWRFHRGESAQLWSVPVVMFLWANLHPGFIAGLGLIAAYVLMEALQLPFGDLRLPALQRMAKAWPWLLGGALVTLLNPFGTKLLSQALVLAGVQNGSSQVPHVIGELTASPLSWHVVRQMFSPRVPESSFWWLVLIAAVAVVLALRRREFGAALVLAAGLYGGLQKLRYQGLFSLIVVVIGGALIAAYLKEREPREDAPNAGVWNGVVAVLLACVFAVSLVRVNDLVSDRYYVVSATTSSFGPGESWWFPERAAAFIEREGLPGNIFQPYNLGGFTALRLGPRYLDYSDGRGINPAILDEEQALLSQSPDSATWQQIASRRNINFMLLSLGRYAGLGSFDLQSYCNATSWRPVYLDEVSLVLVRRTPETEPLLSRLEINCQSVKLAPPTNASVSKRFQFLANYGGVLYMLNRDQEAESAWQQALQLQPADPNVHMYLAQLYREQRRLADSEREFRAALSYRESAETWFALGRLLAAERRYEEAAQAIAASAEMTPTPANNYKALGQAQLLLQKPKLALDSFQRAERSQLWQDRTLPGAREFFAQLAEGRAEAERQLGDLTKALDFQAEATRQTPMSAPRWKKLADIAAEAGNAQIADSAMRRASELSAVAAPQ